MLTGMAAIFVLCQSSAHFLQFASGPIPGLRDSLERVGDFVIEHMGIAQRALDVGMVERPLHQLEVARFAQKLGA